MNAPQHMPQLNLHGPKYTFEDGPSDARVHSEEVLLGAVHVIWRSRRRILAAVGMALVLATVYLLASKKEYTAESFVRLNFESSGINSARVPVDAAIMVEGEARIVRSRGVADRVVERWGLREQPAFASLPGIFSRILNYFAAPAPDSEGLRGVGAPTVVRSAAFVRAADVLTAHTLVDNDTRSYLIGIRFRWPSPDTAAAIANSIAEEYLRERKFQSLFASKSRLEAELSQLSQRVGERHPSLISTRSQLVEVAEEIKAWSASSAPVQAIPLSNFSVEIAIAAVPPTEPSSPKPKVIYGLALLIGLVGSAGAVLLLERYHSGLSNERAAAETLGVRCLGIVPAEIHGDRYSRWMICEAVRTIVIAASLDVKPANCTVVLVASSLPDEGKSLFTTTLASVMTDLGRRVLLVDGVPKPGRDLTAATGGWSPCDDGDEGAYRTVDVCLDGCFPSARFEQELAAARGRYDFILIKAPPVLMLSDAIRLARLSDNVVFLARWRKTQTRTVARAVERMRDAGIRLSGVVLTHVELPGDMSAKSADRGYYLPKYGEFGPSDAANSDVG